MGRLLSLLFVTLLSACAANVPKPIAEIPAGAPTVAEVREEPGRYTGARVRWGGIIASVQNRPDDTLVQVVARRLSDSGRPLSEEQSPGRFIARFDRFMDPALLAEGRRLTVVGELQETMVQPVGEYPYRFPVVAVESHYLWPREERRDRYYYPYHPLWYDPWYDPFYPFRPYPYYW